MRADQEELAVALLTEAVDWIGVDILNNQEEERAEEVQHRISRLLEELKRPLAIPASDPEDCLRVLLQQRSWHELAARERDECRARLADALRAQGSSRSEHVGYLIRRLQVAYDEAERAERLAQNAEGDYYRALLAEKGGHRCSQ